MHFKTFSGGIALPDEKDLTKDRPITKAPLPKKIILPVSQHTGAFLEPLVAVGDKVTVGQRIADSEKFISSPVHSSVSGKVTAIAPHPHPCGSSITSIIIESDGLDTPCENVKPYPDISTLSKEDVRRIVRAAGIVGLGGAAFPTHVKLDPAPGKVIEHYIINGAECEPYLNADNRLMIERPHEVIFGLKALMKPTDAKTGIIAIEDNKPEAIASITKALKGEKNISIMIVKTKYPQGGEKQLVKSLLNKEVPSGGLPLDVGVIVSNVQTAIAVASAIKTGMPLIERVITVAGKKLKNPSNLLVRIGTSISDLIDICGGLPERTRKVLLGGPMTGIAQWSLQTPIIKGVSGIIVLTDDEVDELEDSPCIRCAKCVDACPARLLPNFLGDYAENGLFIKCKEYRAPDCIECGICSYVCPTKRNLTQLIKIAKLELLKNN
jgi:electron transport complex protein RnfC